MCPFLSEQKGDRLLLILRKKPGVYFKLTALEKNLKTDKAGLIEDLVQIKKWGYKFRTRSDAVAFIKAPDVLSSSEISYRLNTRIIGCRVLSYRAVKSTNDLATELADGGAPEGTLVTAEEQTSGRGRLGRKWHSPGGTGIYASLILRPEIKPENAPGISIMTAVALAQAIKKFTKGKVQIKWPNDVLINGRKTAGILTELSAENNKINHVIVGVGINVNHQATDFPDDLRNTATSLRRINRKKVNRAALLKSFLVEFEKMYALYPKHHLKKIHSRVRKLSSLIGNEIKILSGRQFLEGRAVDIDYDGRLILERNGKKIPVVAGEVTVVKEQS